MQYKGIPSHVAKISTLKIPLIGPICQVIENLFVDRGDKHDKNKLLNLIDER